MNCTFHLFHQEFNLHCNPRLHPKQFNRRCVCALWCAGRMCVCIYLCDWTLWSMATLRRAGAEQSPIILLTSVGIYITNVCLSQQSIMKYFYLSPLLYSLMSLEKKGKGGGGGGEPCKSVAFFCVVTIAESCLALSVQQYIELLCMYMYTSEPWLPRLQVSYCHTAWGCMFSVNTFVLLGVTK